MKMKWFIVLIVIRASSAFCLSASTSPVDLDRLTNTYFDAIEVVGTNLVLTFKSTGENCLYRIDRGELIKAQKGQILIVPPTSIITVIKNRDMNITFSPLPENVQAKGFDINEHIDFRSFGGVLNTSRVFIVISPARGQNQINEGPAELHFVEPTVDAVRQVLEEQAIDK